MGKKRFLKNGKESLYKDYILSLVKTKNEFMKKLGNLLTMLYLL